ncbi:uncharacterized protein LOC111405582 [Olea europaea var. sylvestris]|uniref:uncharacterized protein LOC111405582 n=1 Tax=Olea europaea var. sylvestris TaxID=158386 RepID=UPI000C1D4095|nr:uncharacterized protein LOC111405582 [Olea europaea var. sylvestris]XP_022890299.1 uncharacterized protein LOC111405582 [Olea europaea var. sylvestris]
MASSTTKLLALMLVLKSTVNAYRNIPAAVAVLQALRGLSTIDNVLPTLLEEGVHQSYPKGQNVVFHGVGDVTSILSTYSGGMPKSEKGEHKYDVYGFCMALQM